MFWRTLVSPEELASQLANPELVVVDCRFDLRDPGAGERAYQAGHLPGAFYAHLERDLSDMGRTGRGRHPLPEADAFCATLTRWGVTPRHQVVAYDANDSAHAARLWWMLRLLGHERTAVLDGGLAGWVARGYALDAAVPRARPGAKYTARFDVRAMASTAVVAARMASGGGKLVDARAGERFRGEIEPIDRVPGRPHPGSGQPAFHAEPRSGRPLQVAGRAAGGIPRRARRQPAGRDPAHVRLGRDRVPQPAGDGICRAARRARVSGIVERMDQRSVASGGARGVRLWRV
jgi:thiosulfate/3-mercaptopyruvate sulfurtransferase